MSVRQRSQAKMRWGLVALLLVAWALRVSPVLVNRFHPDEALYGYWGLLIGRGRDPLLAAVPVYKPPLVPYLMASVQALLGSSEFAVRLLGLVAGFLTVPLSAALAYALYRDQWTMAMAAVGVAFSPLAISFSATAFLDPLMVALGLAACVAAVRSRSAWAGLLAGLSFAAKQTGLVWLPLVLLLQAVGSFLPERRTSSECGTLGLIPKTFGTLLICFSLVVGLIIAWDAARLVQGAESFWKVGVAGYGGLRLIWPHELWERLREWGGVVRLLFGSAPIIGVLLSGLPVVAWRALTRRSRTCEGLIDVLLVSFFLIYFLLHWLWAFPVWERYLLPLVPVLSLLLGRVVHLISSRLQAFARGHRFAIQSLLFLGCHFLFITSLAWPTFSAALGGYPLTDDGDAYDGMDYVAAFLSGLPEGSVVYHHWLGWHYHYYLFDAPVYLAYWPTPAWLAQDVKAFGARGPRYVTFPSWESSERVERALEGVDYGWEPVLTTTRRGGAPSFTVYRILPLSNQ